MYTFVSVRFFSSASVISSGFSQLRLRWSRRRAGLSGFEVEIAVSRVARWLLRVRYLAMTDAEGRPAWRKSEQAGSRHQKRGSGGMWC